MYSKDKDELKEYLRELCYEERDNLVIVCIGSSNWLGDAVSPMAGTHLSRKLDIPVFGLLAKPIHAKNMRSKLAYIRNEYPDRKILAIDAMLYHDDEDLHGCTIKANPLDPGAGVGKDLPKIGDYSLKYASSKKGNTMNETFDNMRIKFSLFEEISDNITEIVYDALK